MKALVRALGLMLVMGMACSRDPLGLEITVPAGLSPNTVWLEVGAFKNSACPTLQPMLEGGLPEGYASRLAFKKGDPAAPAFGKVPTAKYAFAGIARDANCAIIAAGCSEVDVGDVDNVSITLGPVATPRGQCAAGTTCEAARCLPAADSSNPTLGAGCSLELLGAGPLANTSGQEGTVVSAPAIAATANGFVLVYRELDPGVGARLVLQPLDNSGGALRAERPGLPGRCQASADVERDGVGLAINEGAGTVVLSKAACTADPPDPALELLAFTVDDTSQLTLGQLFDSPSPNGVDVRLGAARPATTRAANNIIVFTEKGAGKIATINREKGILGPNGSFGGTGITDAWVGASDKVLAFLSVGPGDPAGPVPLKDGGADAAVEEPIGSKTDTTLRLLMLPATTDIQTVATNTTRPITFPGTFGSIATTGSRAIVLTDGSGPAFSATYRAFDLGQETEADTDGFSVEGSAKVTAGDVTILGDRAYMVALQQGQVALQVFNNATTALKPVNTTPVLFSKLTRISGISNVRDGSVAVAASPTRVAVVWTTAKELGANDPAGGYAVFACTQ